MTHRVGAGVVPWRARQQRGSDDHHAHVFLLAARLAQRKLHVRLSDKNRVKMFNNFKKIVRVEEKGIERDRKGKIEHDAGAW